MKRCQCTGNFCTYTSCVGMFCSMMMNAGHYTMPPQDWQLCPKCNGKGYTEPTVSGSSTMEQCTVCKGKLIISKQTGQPPTV